MLLWGNQRLIAKRWSGNDTNPGGPANFRQGFGWRANFLGGGGGAAPEILNRVLTQAFLRRSLRFHAFRFKHVFG